MRVVTGRDPLREREREHNDRLERERVCVIADCAVTMARDFSLVLSPPDPFLFPV